MLEESHNLTSFADSDEEDCEIYFLQPAVDPYDMKKKVEEANRELFSNALSTTRCLKIKFRENLVDYEPDLTDDDIQSIESYNEDINYSTLCQQPDEDLLIYSLITTVEENHALKNNEEHIDENSVYGYKKIVKDNFNETIDNEDITEEIEEILNSQITEECENDIRYVDVKNMNDKNINLHKTRMQIKSNTSTSNIKINQMPKTENILIHCKSHCIQKVELELSMKRLHINKKPVCPSLKLQKRKCCEENYTKLEQKLPRYVGLRSEYGLTRSQLDKRKRTHDLNKLRQKRHLQLLEEYKERKIQQNEEIFLQWLKNIENRKIKHRKKQNILIKIV